MTIQTSAAYVLGRRRGHLQPPYQGHDLVFSAERLDGQAVEDAGFKHCTFANISFKGVVFRNGSFLNCVFIGCYFRGADLRSTSFIGCRFVDCNFNKVAIKASHFNYCLFQGCQIPFDELRHSLPPEPNLREDLARNLYLESTRLGLSSQASQYRLVEIRAREDHLRAAVTGSSKWYRDHFDSTARFRAALGLAASLLNRWLWGYGERSLVLVRNVLFLSLVAFPAVYYVFLDGFAKPAGGVSSVWDAIQFSVATMLPGGIGTTLDVVGVVPRILAAVEAVFGVVAVTLFASYIFRWSLHR